MTPITVNFDINVRLDMWYTTQLAVTPVKPFKNRRAVARGWNGRAMSLFYRLNDEMINLNPMSHRARRACRLMPRLVDAMEQRA